MLFQHLFVVDLVKLIESFIPLNSSDLIPLWYLQKKDTEFYQLKPQSLYAPVVWNYYAYQHTGVRLYILTQHSYKDSISTHPTQLKLQICEQYFSKHLSHPKCLCAFQTILANQPLLPYYYNSIINHLEFWIYIVTCHITKYTFKELELEGFFPIVWLIFIYILRSEAPLFKKKKIIKFLLKYPFFCYSIQNKWTNFAGEFLEALSTAPDVGDSLFIHTLKNQGENDQT